MNAIINGVGFRNNEIVVFMTKPKNIRRVFHYDQVIGFSSYCTVNEITNRKNVAMLQFIFTPSTIPTNLVDTAAYYRRVVREDILRIIFIQNR